MDVRPQRITFERRRGFSLQRASLALNGLPAKLVTRPGRWGNPFSVAEVARCFDLGRDEAQARAVALHRAWMIGLELGQFDPGYRPPPLPELMAALGGHNLSCWCKQGTPCHADLLLALSNP